MATLTHLRQKWTQKRGRGVQPPHHCRVCLRRVVLANATSARKAVFSNALCASDDIDRTD
jgi:hypothetical protein